MEKTPKLSPEDQRRVDEVTSTGIHAMQRKPFRPLVLLGFLFIVVTTMTVISIALERMYIE